MREMQHKTTMSMCNGDMGLGKLHLKPYIDTLVNYIYIYGRPEV